MLQISKPLLVVYLCCLLLCPAWADKEVFVSFIKPKSAKLMPTYEHLKNSPYLMVPPGGLDNFLDFPRKLRVVYQEDHKPSAYYSSKHHAIVISYEFYELLLKIFRQAKYDAKESQRLADWTLTYFLCHEFGHALISELNLPVTGPEEDCADEFAAVYVNTFLGREGESMAIAAASFYLHFRETSDELRRIPFWDEHSLDRQRCVNIICALHAASKGKVMPDLGNIAPAERIRISKARYPRKRRSWMKLIGPFVPPDPGQAKRRQLPPRPKTTGRLKIVYSGKTTPEGKKMFDRLSKPKLVYGVCDPLNKLFTWPRNLTVLVTETGGESFHYLPSSAEMVFGIEHFRQIDRVITRHGLKGRDAEEMFRAVVTYTLMKEMGVVLLSELGLPWTGDTEDVGPEFVLATTLRGKGGAARAKRVAQFLGFLSAEHKTGQNLNYWETGHFPEQYRLQILGYLYAQDPSNYPEAKRLMPPRRLARYQRDYKLKKQRWRSLLSPYSRKKS